MQAGALLRCPHCGREHPREAKACPTTGRAMPGAFLPGQVLDRKYRILHHLADGGMGAVYEAEHLSIGKRVAVKALHPELSKNEDMIARFQREARAASAIGHQNIVDMSDLGRAPDGAMFIVMELLRGQNLADRLTSVGGRMPIGRAAHVVRQVLEALAAAHRHGIVHRDLKPENIFLVHRGQDPDFVKVLDFGISKVLTDDGPRLSTTGVVLGTPYYMAPEQARGGPLDHRTDIYACGAILYQLVTGRLPFTAPNFNALMFEIAGGRYVPPRALVPEIPPSLEQVIQYAMALDPAYRYQTAEHMAQSLAPFAQPVIVPAPPPEAQEDSRTPSALNAFLPPPPELGAAPAAPVKPVLEPSARRGRALPITIAAGVAVGVCVGLLIIRKTDGGSGQAPAATAATTAPAAAPTNTTPAAAAPEPPKPVVAAPEPEPAAVASAPSPVPAPAPAPAAPEPAPPTAAPPPEASPSPTPTPLDVPPIQVGRRATAPPRASPEPRPVETRPAPAPVQVTLTVRVAPPEAAAAATITIDGADAPDGRAAVTAGRKVRVVVKAKGWATHDKRVELAGDETIDVTLEKEATKPPSAPGGSIKL